MELAFTIWNEGGEWNMLREATDDPDFLHQEIPYESSAYGEVIVQLYHHPEDHLPKFYLGSYADDQDAAMSLVDQIIVRAMIDSYLNYDHSWYGSDVHGSSFSEKNLKPADG